MIEPPVSVPSAKPTIPADVDAPEPLDEPDVVRSNFHGLCGNGTRFERVDPPANSDIVSFAIRIAPALLSLSTHVASRSGTRSLKIMEPQVVRIPFVSNRSFNPYGIPWSGPRIFPDLISFSAC